MKLHALALISTATSTFIAIPPSLAAPHVYTTGSLLSTDLKTCMADAKSAADKAGFTSDHYDALDDDKKDGTFFATKPDIPTSLAVRCYPSGGVVTFAIGGINQDQTWDSYRKYIDSFYKK
jgi:hypothetical protein